MEAQAALVRADRRTVLDPVAAIDLDFAVIVDPGDAELHHAFGFDQPVKHAMLGILRMKPIHGQRLSITSVTACRYSAWPGLRSAT